MIKKTFLQLAVLVLFSCASSTAVQEGVLPETFTDRNYMDTSPYNDELVFLGASSVRNDKKESIRLALEGAARKVAMYHSVGGHISHEESRGPGFLDYRSQHDAAIEIDELYQQYADALIYDEKTDIFTYNHTVFVRARYHPPSPVVIAHTFRAGNQRPAWIDRAPPTIPGYRTGVGFAGPRSYLKDTIIASYENAVFYFIGAASSQVSSQQNIRNGSVSIDGSIRSSGVLKGFYVLEIWVEPTSKAVWTLAIVRDE
jgi:hypothetical protein